MNTNKIYGKYSGFLSKEGIEKVKEGTELELYFTINSIGGMIWRMNHDASHGRITITEEMHKDLDEAQHAIEFAVMHTRRFGTEIPDPKENAHVERTDSYNKWFSWWNDYIQYKLSDSEYMKLEQMMSNKEDCSGFRPEGTWK